MSKNKVTTGVTGESYDRMVDRVMNTLDSVNELSAQTFNEVLNDAIELEDAAIELTVDEAHLVKQYLLRDFARVKQDTLEAGRAIRKVLQLDIDLLEKSVLDRLFKVADQTRVDFELLREQLGHGDAQYAAGELALPGQFVCSSCGEAQSLHSSRKLNPCSVCSGVLFERASSK